MGKFEFEKKELEPVIELVVKKTIDEIESSQNGTNCRWAYSEEEVAEKLGVAKYVVRDARLRGEFKAKKVGKEYRYSKREIDQFLNSRD